MDSCGNNDITFYNYFNRIEDEELKKVVTIIEELFPTECAAVYFTEFRMENGVRVAGFGKLRNRFEYLKTNLRAQGILKSARSQ